MRKRGISLIVLIITIIVVIILAAVVILTLSKNNPIESAKEASFKEDIRTFQDELALAVSKEYANAAGQRDEKITTSDFDEIKQYIPSFSEKYKEKFIIQDDELRYTKQLDDKEKEYAQSLNVNKRKSILPNEYQQVEYIESTGVQSMYTGIVPVENTSVILDFTPLIISPGTLFGCQEIDQQISFRLFNYNGRIYFDLNGRIVGDYMPANERVNIELHNYYVIKNGNKVIQSLKKTNFKNTKELRMFYDNEYCKTRIYKCEIKEGDESKRRFFPCYSTTTVTDINGRICPYGTKGMYDTVEGKFYTNQGTGEDFIPGPDVD